MLRDRIRDRLPCPTRHPYKGGSARQGAGTAPPDGPPPTTYHDRETTLTSIYAVTVAVMLAQLHPTDRLTYCRAHRGDWDGVADLPSSELLVRLAELIPGCREMGDGT